MAYYGRYGHGLKAFAREWNLTSMKQDELDPVIFDALQSFLDIVSPERGYRLSFTESGTASTSFATKRVTVTTEALRGRYLVDTDPWEKSAADGKATKAALRRSQSGVNRFYVTVGMICHEVSHIRYGQDTAGAVQRKYGKSKNYALAQRISNILDENRIEAAFAWDFPGFKDVFPHVLEWVARKQNGGSSRTQVRLIKDRADALNVALMGSRFYQFCRTYDPKAREALEWGRKWDEKYTKNDTVKLHLAGVEAMIEWLKQFPPPPREPKPEPEDTSCPPPPPPSDEPEDEDGPAPIDFGDEDDEDGEVDDGWQERGSDDETEEDDEDDASAVGDQSNDDEGEEDEDGFDSDEDDDLDSIAPVEDEDGEPVLSEDEADEAMSDIPNTDAAVESQSTREDKRMEKEMEKALGSIEIIAASESAAQTRLTRNPKPRKGVTSIPTGDAAIAAEVRLAFESTRYAHDEWAGGYTSGRFRSRDAAKAASGELNAFSRRTSESSTRVHLALLVDYSGSMMGKPFDQACALAQTLVEAMDSSQVYRQSVWQYLTGGYFNYRRNVELNRLWISGDPKAIRNALIDGGPADSGTPTGPALYALGHEMVADRKADEAMVVLSITDGDPDEPGAVVHAVQHWAERGVIFIGVNINCIDPNSWYYLNNPEQLNKVPARMLAQKHKMEAQYGEGHSIEFDGNWKHLAEDIGTVVGKALAGTVGK